MIAAFLKTKLSHVHRQYSKNIVKVLVIISKRDNYLTIFFKMF